MNQLDFKGRTGIVTGGATGIGLAIVKRLLASGARVRIWDRDGKLLAGVVEELGANASGDALDVSDPLAVPGLISAGIFAFTLSWNEFIYALTFVSSSEVKTVPVGVVTELVEGDVYHWGPLMAGALLGSLPVAFVYSFFVEHYVSGMTGSVKE